MNLRNTGANNPLKPAPLTLSNLPDVVLGDSDSANAPSHLMAAGFYASFRPIITNNPEPHYRPLGGLLQL